MAVRWQILEANIKRRREAEHQRVTRTQALTRYYDHWDTVTARHHNWTSPKYYDQAEQKMQQQRQLEENNARLAERRQQMRQLLDSERIAYEELVLEQKVPRTRKEKAHNELLLKINQNMKERAQIWDKVDHEARICGRWRDNDQSLYKAKESHAEQHKIRSQAELPSSCLSAPYGTFSEPVPSREMPHSYHLPLTGFNFPSGNRSATTQAPGDVSNAFKPSTDFPINPSATLCNSQLPKFCPKSADSIYKPTEAGLPMELPSSRIPSRIPKDVLPLLASSFSHLNLDGGTITTSSRGGALDRAMRNARIDNVAGAYNAALPTYPGKRES